MMAADVGVPLADVDRVAVGRGAREPADRDAAPRPADILHDDRLPERLAHPLRQNAPGHVGRASRRKWHDQRDGARRESVGAHWRGARHRDQDQHNGCTQNTHDPSPFGKTYWPGLIVSYRLAAAPR